MYCVYIIYSKTIDSFYIGETIDIESRIKQHNESFYETGYTKQTKDWILYYKIECNSRTQARKIETHIKKMKSKRYIQNLKKYPEIIEKLKNKYN
ncbi:GIY-YIG nuclease family protein [Winogradskyella immobilis]|uniref:GIY-YIG nuclease family protein n=1 Tax=Winogradskyella immobilis TaxID=2816852 RepID=A0ABS8EQV6_9FLAO|nr:GIY-YIG nuclease family protein [Winogradskyella immobilis]MCC1485227.1 GIY-YIG nuclease family protein [Winogradskyella immobilis]MCG0017319.1 GIY-YIG nuclease family protein [Winogradskyella immobilis]